MPPSMERREQAPGELDIERALEAELGKTPEGMEKPVEFAAKEQEELSEAAVAGVTEEDPALQQRAARKFRARIVATGMPWLRLCRRWLRMSRPERGVATGGERDPSCP